MRSAAWPAPLFARSTSSPARSGIDDGEPLRHRDVNAPDARAFDQQIADGETSNITNKNEIAKPAIQPGGVRRVKTIELILSVTDLKL